MIIQVETSHWRVCVGYSVCILTWPYLPEKGSLRVQKSSTVCVFRVDQQQTVQWNWQWLEPLRWWSWKFPAIVQCRWCRKSAPYKIARSWFQRVARTRPVHNPNTLLWCWLLTSTDLLLMRMMCADSVHFESRPVLPARLWLIFLAAISAPLRRLLFGLKYWSKKNTYQYII